MNLGQCRPRVKEPSQGSAGISWRRKSKSKYPPWRSSTDPSSSRPPTLLLPPMRCTSGESDSNTTAPVITTRVQRSDPGHESFLTLDNSTHLPLPSAPSPGHLFYNSEDHSDLTFIVGLEEWRFPAHSFIMNKKQSTLDAILKSALGITHFNEVKSKLANMEVDADGSVRPIVLKIPNMQPEVFEQIYRYIYTGQVSFQTAASALRLLHPSHVYHLPHLTSHCLIHLTKNVNATNVLTVLSFLLFPEVHQTSTSLPSDNEAPDCHENDNERNELVFKCFLIIDRYADDVLQNELFETMELELLVEIVKRDTLEVSSEAVVFDSVMRWACRACKKQRKELTSENKCAVLGKALFLVRYLTMTPEEFLRGPVSHAVLSKEDKELFLSRLATPSSPTHLPLPERWNGWKIDEKRQRHHSHSLLAITSPELVTENSDLAVSPSNSIQPVNPKSKKKSMSKKLLNGVGDLVICVIQLLD